MLKGKETVMKTFLNSSNTSLKFCQLQLKREHDFTLIELLIVIAIIGIR